MTLQRLRIGTRGSQLALAQARETAQHIQRAHPGLEMEIVPIQTSGDRQQEISLTEIGGKGLFTKEIEEALLGGSIDLAVHSMKDMPTTLPKGLIMAAYWEREDPRDAFLSSRYESIESLPKGAKFGTSSLRRAAQLLMHRPDLTIVPFRGNVETRLRKLADGIADATLLACAGLKRIGKPELAARALPVEQFLPAVAQGAIGVECRGDQPELVALLRALSHLPTETAVTAERAFLAALDGSCRTPIAALAELSGSTLHLRGLIVTPDGARHHSAERTGNATDAERLGREMGEELKLLGGERFFNA